MKSRIANLTSLEKKYFLIGSIVFSILFFYFGILSPLKNNVATLRRTVSKESALLAWVKNADKHIATTSVTTNGVNYHSLLSDVQADIQHSSLAKHLTLFKQGNNDSVVVKFEKVSFDNFSNWLSTLLKAKQLKISELNVIAGDKKGVVDTELTLIK